MQMELAQIIRLAIALYDDQGPFARAKLVRLVEILSEKPRATDVIARLLVGRSSDPCYGFDHINPSITDANFPTSSEPSIKGAELKKYGKWVSSQFVSDDLAACRRRAATPAETLAYVLAHPELKDFWIVALRQTWVSNNNEFAVVLCGISFADTRNASLASVVAGWAPQHQFLSFPLEEEEGIAA